MQLGSPLCTALALEPNSLIDGGLSTLYSGIAHGEMCQAVVGLLTNHWPAAAQLDFLPVDERVTIKWLRNAERKTITVVYACFLVAHSGPGQRRIPTKLYDQLNCTLMCVYFES